MPTIVAYEEWKLLPEATTTGPITEHPEFWELGKSDDGKAVARLKKEKTDEYLALIEKKAGVPPNTLGRSKQIDARIDAKNAVLGILEQHRSTKEPIIVWRAIAALIRSEPDDERAAYLVQATSECMEEILK